MAQDMAQQSEGAGQARPWACSPPQVCLHTQQVASKHAGTPISRRKLRTARPGPLAAGADRFVGEHAPQFGNGTRLAALVPRGLPDVKPHQLCWHACEMVVKGRQGKSMLVPI